MMRSGDLLIAAAAVVALSLAASPVLAGAEACPTPVPDHIPAAPLPPLNLGTIKDLLLEYHQKYYDIDVAAVFDSAQKYIEQNAAQSKRPALVLDIDETSLTNWPNLLADNFGFVADGSCDVLPKGPCGFNQWILKGRASFRHLFSIGEQTWTGDHLQFRVSALGQSASGSIDVAEDYVKLEVFLPWLLAKLAETLQPLIRKEAVLLLEKK